MSKFWKQASKTWKSYTREDSDLFWDYWDELKAKYPDLLLVEGHESWFFKTWFKLSPWKRKAQPNFLSTVVGCAKNEIVMPKSQWGTLSGYLAMRHEAVHQAQWHKYGWFYPLTWFFVFPWGPGFRFLWEYPAYVEGLKAHYEVFGKISPNVIETLVWVFSKEGYKWMFPFPKLIRKMLNKERAKIIAAGGGEKEKRPEPFYGTVAYMKDTREALEIDRILGPADKNNTWGEDAEFFTDEEIAAWCSWREKVAEADRIVGAEEEVRKDSGWVKDQYGNEFYTYRGLK
jgi:hypothetical protein